MRLTTHLLITTAGCALLAFVLAMAVLLTLEHRASMRQLEHIADTGERILRGQLMGLRESVTLDARFPDWSALSVVARGDGSCFKLEHPNGQPWRSDCRGAAANGDVPPWFAATYRVLFAPARRVTRDIARGHDLHARLALSVDGEAEIARSWAESRRMAALSAALVASLCLVLAWFMTRALRPLAAVVAHLESLAAGSRHARLGAQRHTEMQRIAEACDSLAATLAALEQQRAQLSLRLLEVQEHERRQLARDLHDEFGQHLTALAATTATLRRSVADDDEPLQRALERSADSIAHLHTLVRDVLTRLRPPGLDELGLCAAVQALVADWNRRCADAPRINAHCDPRFDALPAPLAAEILRIVQEALTNAVRHAAAQRVVVSLARVDDCFEIEICDDGRGAGASVAGHGLTGLGERAAACAGTLAIEHLASGGLRVRVRIPAANIERAT
ncbi:MAG: ATP-binding protein [Gammaproteobacteria bacterium]|nr:ATP-binding protein [Gammaproteobacteria bacterium]